MARHRSPATNLSFHVLHLLLIPPTKPNRFPDASPTNRRGTEQLLAVPYEVTAFVVLNMQFKENDIIQSMKEIILRSAEVLIARR